MVLRVIKCTSDYPFRYKRHTDMYVCRYKNRSTYDDILFLIVQVFNINNSTILQYSTYYRLLTILYLSTNISLCQYGTVSMCYVIANCFPWLWYKQVISRRKKSELMVFSLSIETKKLHTKLLVIIYI